MEMTNTTYKTIYDIPMDKITYDNIMRSRHDLITRDLIDDLPSVHIEYDEDLQIATFNSYGLPFSLEQTSYYIIIIIDNCDEFPPYYFINKKTGECSWHKPDSISPGELVDGLVRVYGQTESQLLEADFISDKLKRCLQILIWERELEDREIEAQREIDAERERDAERDADNEF